MRSSTILILAGVVLLIASLLGLNDHTEELDEAYTEGHEAGRMWCGRMGTVIDVPPYEGEFREKWYQGFELGQRAAGCEYSSSLSEGVYEGESM